MKSLRNTLISILALALIVVVLELSGVVSLRDILGLGEVSDAAAEQRAPGNTAPAAADSNWGKPSKAQSDMELHYQEIQQLLSNLDAGRKKALLDDADAFSKFIVNEGENLSVLQAARVNKVDQDKNTRFLMQRAADNTLRASYINKLMAEKFPADFPNDDQIKEFYEKNKDKFVLSERVHVWQIFLQFDEKKNKTDAAALEKKAADILARIKQGKLDFTAAALQYSDHYPSKENGGDMGLVKVSELKPEISKPLLALKEGELSQPIRSENGIHILKRGAIIPRQEVGLEQVRPQLIEALKNQARNQFRTAIFQQAGKTYPVKVSDKKIEEWRLRLRTDLPQGK